jgi:hypothetical protein
LLISHKPNTMSDNPNTFAALNAVRETRQTQLLSKATFTAFDDGMLLAAQDMLHGVEYGALGLIMTTVEWEAMPLNVRDDGTFKPFPRPPAVPNMPQPLEADANPAAHAVYMRVLADIKVAEGRRHAIMSADSALKEIYRSAIIMGPENAAAAIGDGTVLEQMRDTARNMRARITAHLGTPDTATFDHWKKIYTTPASGMLVAEWTRLESLANKALTKHRRSLPEDLRTTAFIQCYEASPGVATCVREYKRTVPALENQSFADLLTYAKPSSQTSNSTSHEPPLDTSVSRKIERHPLPPLPVQRAPPCTPTMNRQKSEYLRCYKATYDFYKRHGHIPEIQRLNNETSFVLEQFLRLEQVEAQYVPPGIHRQNPAERAIRSVKNTLIAMCSTTDPTFPAEKLFEDALPQANIVINCLRPWHPNRSINAWTGMHRKPYDDLAYPMSVYGTKVVVQDKPDARAAWAPHGTDGFYVGPASKHYRCWRCYMPATRSVCITDTVAWLPVAFTMPGHSPLDGRQPL